MRAHARPALIAAGLFVATLATRTPFMSDRLWAWDSVLYARALEDGFHVDYVTADQRPHPPGYLFYVATAAAIRQITADSNSALVIISMIASALAVAALFLFARRFASDRSAAFVSVGFALSPEKLETAIRNANQNNTPQVIVVSIDTEPMPPYGWPQAPISVCSN